MSDLKYLEPPILNIRTIDYHHQQLFDYLRFIIDSIDQKQQDFVLRKAFDDLEVWAIKHFSAEETLMEVIGYPNYEKHKLEHMAFSSKIKALRYDIPSRRVTVEVIMTLQDWLIDHIGKSDKSYADFYAEHRKQNPKVNMI